MCIRDRVHSVVFGGFASNELASRIDDSKAKILLTASCGFEPGRTVQYKPLVDEALKLVWFSICDMKGGEIYVKKIPSMKVIDIAKAVAPEAKQEIVGIRPGEKLHRRLEFPILWA